MTTMNSDLRDLVTFHLTGARAGGEPTPAEAMRPALLARYGDLSQLRYDFPLVLIDGAEDGAFVRSLTDIVNEVLRVIAPPGIAGERLRKHVLRLDREIRRRIAGGARGTLRHLWARAERKLIADVEPAGRDQLVASLSRAQEVLRVDGQVIDCCDQLPERLFTHAWAVVSGRLWLRGRARIERLLLGVRGILDADRNKSAAGRTADLLAQEVSPGFSDAFDFDALSRLLTATASADLLPASRRARLEEVVRVLEGQRFFPAAGAEGFEFAYATIDAAVTAFEERLPDMVALVKAMAIAELELDNRYREARHDEFFAGFDAATLVAEDFAHFPVYLVSLRERDLDAAARARLLELCGSPLPIKVVVHTEDLLNGAGRIGGQFTLGGSPDLGRLALGLGSAFVLQAPASSLYPLSDAIARGLSFGGPALFSVYAGAARPALPAYLASAAAMQSRAFPVFTYDPSAGADWASRFSLADNPAIDADWASESVVYEDDELQRASAQVAFTYLDFLACDPRFADHLAVVPRDHWVDAMVPASDYLANGGGREHVPYLWMVSADQRLHRVVVDAQAIRAAQRCVTTWHSLQELGGVHNSHAERSLRRAREEWDQEKQQEIALLRAELETEAAPPAPVATTPAESAAAGAEPAVEPEPCGPVEEAYIETSRCTTCNECTNRNGKMFVYNENKQAVIGDLAAGTFRQMVEAAEACKVAIIHPGKPWNPDEPDLEALMERAAPFN